MHDASLVDLVEDKNLALGLEVCTYTLARKAWMMQTKLVYWREQVSCTVKCAILLSTSIDGHGIPELAISLSEPAIALACLKHEYGYIYALAIHDLPAALSYSLSFRNLCTKDTHYQRIVRPQR